MWFLFPLTEGVLGSKCLSLSSLGFLAFSTNGHCWFYCTVIRGYMRPLLGLYRGLLLGPTCVSFCGWPGARGRARHSLLCAGVKLHCLGSLISCSCQASTQEDLSVPCGYAPCAGNTAGSTLVCPLPVSHCRLGLLRGNLPFPLIAFWLWRSSCDIKCTTQPRQDTAQGAEHIRGYISELLNAKRRLCHCGVAPIPFLAQLSDWNCSRIS